MNQGILEVNSNPVCVYSELPQLLKGKNIRAMTEI